MFNVALRKNLAVLAVACVLHGVSIPSALAATKGSTTINNNGINFWAGNAVTATSYSVSRDADAPNQLHFNVPTGASMEWSINDVGKMFLTSAGNFYTTGKLGIGGSPVATLDVTQSNSTSGTPWGLLYAGGTHTGLSASSEVMDWDVAIDRTVQWLVGAKTNQRAIFFRTPTYAFTAASTIDSAATVAIQGAPIAGTNATITDSAALWLNSGKLRMENHIWWGTGVAVSASKYSIGRDLDATNQLHLNVPTGAGMEFSINDVGKMVLNSSGYFGVGTTTPLTRFTVADTGTSTLTIDTTSTTQGACLEYKDRDGSGYTYVTYNNGAQYVSSTSCK